LDYLKAIQGIQNTYPPPVCIRTYLSQLARCIQTKRE